MTELPLLSVTEDEAEHVADALAKIVTLQKKRAKKITAKLEKHGPWLTLVLVLGAIYGPRAFMLWKMAQAEKVGRPRIVTMQEKREREEEIDKPSAVN